MNDSMQKLAKHIGDEQEKARACELTLDDMAGVLGALGLVIDMQALRAELAWFLSLNRSEIKA